MKINVKNASKEFNPIDVCIRIETLEEFLLITDMLGFNKSIPEIVYSEEDLQNKLTEMMNKIRSVLMEQRTC